MGSSCWTLNVNLVWDPGVTMDFAQCFNGSVPIHIEWTTGRVRMSSILFPLCLSPLLSLCMHVCVCLSVSLCASLSLCACLSLSLRTILSVLCVSLSQKLGHTHTPRTPLCKWRSLLKLFCLPILSPPRLQIASNPSLQYLRWLWIIAFILCLCVAWDETTSHQEICRSKKLPLFSRVEASFSLGHHHAVPGGHESWWGSCSWCLSNLNKSLKSNLSRCHC